jgi:hypothetical protein
VWVRVFPLVAFIALALFRVVPPVVVVFGLVDAAGAAWTYAVLRQQPNVLAERLTER